MGGCLWDSRPRGEGAWGFWEHMKMEYMRDGVWSTLLDFDFIGLGYRHRLVRTTRARKAVEERRAKRICFIKLN